MVGSRHRHLADFVDREALRPLIFALPDRQRTILALRFFEEKTQSQIAEQLGMSQMHVSRLLADPLSPPRLGYPRAVDRILACLRSHGTDWFGTPLAGYYRP